MLDIWKTFTRRKYLRVDFFLSTAISSSHSSLIHSFTHIMSSLLNRASMRATSHARFYRHSNIRTFNSATLSLPSTPVSSTSTHAHISEDSHSEGIATTTLGRIGSYISDLIPSIVFAAVPKSKSSHSKKRMRQATKGLKEQKNIVQCPGCGQAKLMHHLCTHCYRGMKGRGPASKAGTDTEAQV